LWLLFAHACDFLTIIIKGKHRHLIYTLSLISFTYLGNFILFYLFPTVGPQITPEISEWSKSSYTGYWISSITKWIQSNGSIVGGAFPSSHVSGSMIWALVTRKIYRPGGKFLILMTAGVAVSTVYLGYHHSIDPIMGLIWGYVSFRLLEPRCNYLIAKNVCSGINYI